MTLKRGDVVLARVPHTAGTRGKKRPAVVIQSDVYNATLRHVVVAEVTSNPRWLGDLSCLAIDVSTPEGQATGLHKNGVVSCLHLVTMSADRLGSSIGTLSSSQMRQLDDCLKAALGLP
jgi:mRNA-degrading endonuclease toxin of MazEF toxin-antitoxin module